MQDNQIIALYFERDELAIKMSAENYGSYCRKIAMNILSNLEDSEECVNDTWYQAWCSIPPQKPNSLAAYFGRITRNCAISKYRANRAKKRFDGITILLSELEDCIPVQSNIEQEMDAKRLAEIINDWLKVIPADDRILFVRRYWFGDTVKSLAKKCGLSQNQMSWRMFKLREKLKNEIEKEGILI